MPITNPPGIDPAPLPAPQRNDRLTFSGRVDAFVTWLTAAVAQFGAVATNVYNNSIETYNNALAALSSANAAAASASAAAGAANALPWVNGATYAQYAGAISTVNTLLYRKRTASSVTVTDPALDPTNWAIATGSITPVLAGTTSSAVPITLTKDSAGVQVLNFTAPGQHITLPDATTMPSNGGPVFIFKNAGGYPFGIRNAAGVLINVVGLAGLANISLSDKSTAAGVWPMSGTGLEPGLITFETTLSSTFRATSGFIPWISLDNNTSIHFVPLVNGFAACVVDAVGKVISTPVTVTATASSVPLAIFKISATKALLFYGASATDNNAVVLDLTGSSPTLSLTIGTPVSYTTTMGLTWGGEDSYAVPRIAQLSTTSYQVAYTSSTSLTATFNISVSGSTVTLGAVANIITSNAVLNTVAIYPLTATTAAVLYKSGAAAPFNNNCVVVSVSGTTSTVGTPAALTGNQSSVGANSPPSSMQVSATKLIVVDNNNSANVTATAITISGTTVTPGTALTSIESATSEIFYNASASRFTPHLWLLSAGATNRIGLWFKAATGSRVIVLSETSGTITSGGTLYRTFSTSASVGDGQILPQGATEITALQTSINASIGLQSVTNKISGNNVTVGNGSVALRDLHQDQPSTYAAGKTSGGDYVLLGQGVINTSSGVGAARLGVIRANGDAIENRGTVGVPALGLNGAAPSTLFPIPIAASNRAVIVGGLQATSGSGSGTPFVRILNLELAA